MHGKRQISFKTFCFIYTFRWCGVLHPLRHLSCDSTTARLVGKVRNAITGISANFSNMRKFGKVTIATHRRCYSQGYKSIIRICVGLFGCVCVLCLCIGNWKCRQHFVIHKEINRGLKDKWQGTPLHKSWLLLSALATFVGSVTDMQHTYILVHMYVAQGLFAVCVAC